MRPSRAMLPPVIVLATVIVASCGGSKPDPAPAPAPVPAPAPAPAPAAAPGLDLKLSDAAKCESMATPVSIEVKAASFGEVLKLFGEMSDMELTCDRCPPGLTVTGKIDDAPWDCVVNSLAAQANLSVTVGEKTITLAPKP